MIEYAKFGNLKALIESVPESPMLRLSLAADVGKGIQGLHEAGLIWSDVKPENVLVFPSSKGPFPYQLKICDFGASERVDAYCSTWTVPKGSQEWRSLFSLFWVQMSAEKHMKTISVPNSTQEASELENLRAKHRRHCVHFDTFVYGLLTLWIVTGSNPFSAKFLEGYREQLSLQIKKDSVVRDVKAALQKIKVLASGIAIDARNHLNTHLSNLKARKIATGLPDLSLLDNTDTSNTYMSEFFELAFCGDASQGDPITRALAKLHSYLLVDFEWVLLRN